MICQQEALKTQISKEIISEHMRVLQINLTKTLTIEKKMKRTEQFQLKEAKLSTTANQTSHSQHLL